VRLLSNSSGSSYSVRDLWNKYGMKFFGVYYSVYCVGLGTLATMANALPSTMTVGKVNYLLPSAEVTEENMYTVLAKSAGLGYLIDLDNTEISPLVGSLVVGFALNLALEPLRLPLALAITARITRNLP
jgi:hypothetical protein